MNAVDAATPVVVSREQVIKILQAIRVALLADTADGRVRMHGVRRAREIIADELRRLKGDAL